MPGTHRRITSGQISKAVGDILYEYQTDVLNGINAAGEAAMSDLVKITARHPSRQASFAGTSPSSGSLLWLEIASSGTWPENPIV